MNWQRDEYLLTDDRTRLDLDAVWAWLQSSYWAAERSRAVVEKSLEGSMCFGLFHGNVPVGFARAVTDHATFAYIADVVIAPEHRGRGLGKWMMECVVNHPGLAGQTLLLRTRDAHGLYERFGFERMECLKMTAGQGTKGGFEGGVQERI